MTVVGPRSTTVRLCRALLAAASAILPPRARPAWREAWEGEVRHRWELLAGGGGPSLRERLDLIRRAAGAFSHALWLAARAWRTEPMIQDLRYALRALAARPLFAGAAIVSLAVGIAAATIVWTLIDGTILRPFPYADLDRLVALEASFPAAGGRPQVVEAFSGPELDDVEAGVPSLDRLLAFDLGNRDLGGIDEPQRLFTAFLWHDAFRTLGVPPALGRGFTAGEIASKAPVAIVSHRVWRERLGGDPAAIGRTVLINGEPQTVVGVMPAGVLLLGTDLWLPMWAARGELPRDRRQMTVLARLAPGATLETATTELATLAARTEQEHGPALPQYAGWRLRPERWLALHAREAGPAAWILLGAIGLVLVVTCSNLAALLLARAVAREGEMAVRAALGAERLRLVRQLATESGILALAGGAGGLLLAALGLEAAFAALPSHLIPIEAAPRIDGRALAFAAALTTGCGLLFGLAPAFAGSRSRPAERFANPGRLGGRREGRLRHALVLAEVALATALVVGAALLGRSLDRLYRVDPGFDLANGLSARITLPWQRYRDRESMHRFFATLVARLEATPGIRAAAVASQLAPDNGFRDVFEIEGRHADPGEPLPNADLTVASPGLFATLGVPRVRGGGLPDRLAEGAEATVVVNEAFVRRYFPGTDPIGRRLRSRAEEERPWVRIAGVVGDVRNRGLDQEVEPEVFLPLAASDWNQLFVTVRTEGPALAALPLLRSVVRELDPGLAVYAVSTLEGRFSRAEAMRRIASLGLAIAAGVALLIAAVGVYALVALAVRSRTREIGVRIVLGAGRGTLVAWAMGRTLVPIVAGLGVGVAGAAASTRALVGLLYGVSPPDPAAFAGAALAILSAGVLAAWLAARRAGRLDPQVALREL